LRLHRHIPGEVGWDTGVGRSSFIQPSSRILMEKPLADKFGQKNGSTNPNFYMLANVFFDLSL
jgi:hypothetical protein